MPLPWVDNFISEFMKIWISMAPCVHCVEHDDIEAKQQIRLRTNNDSVTKNDIYVTTTISTRIHDTIEEFESAEATLHGAPWPGNSNDAVHDLSDYSPNPVIPFNDADNEAKEEVKEKSIQHVNLAPSKEQHLVGFHFFWTHSKYYFNTQ
eukprot:742736_1